MEVPVHSQIKSFYSTNLSDCIQECNKWTEEDKVFIKGISVAFSASGVYLLVTHHIYESYKKNTEGVNNIRRNLTT